MSWLQTAVRKSRHRHPGSPALDDRQPRPVVGSHRWRRSIAPESRRSHLANSAIAEARVRTQFALGRCVAMARHANIPLSYHRAVVDWARRPALGPRGWRFVL